MVGRLSDQRFPRQCRIRRGADFDRAFKLRCAAGDDRLLIFGHRNGLPYPRLGLSVSRKLGGAVIRNRWKRLIREAFRISRGRLPSGVDLVVVPRQNVQPELEPLIDSMLRLAKRVARRLEEDPGHGPPHTNPTGERR